MTAAVPQSLLQAPRTVPKEAPVGDSNCKKVIQAIIAIAIKILVPLATALLYFPLPLSISVVAIPLATAASLFAITFFFKVRQEEPVLPLSRTAPCGLQNSGGNDCWLNSLVQMMRIDKEMKEWFTKVPRDLDAHATYFKFFSQQLLENLPEVLPEQAYGDLGGNAEARQRINEYAALIRRLPHSDQQTLFRYLRFLRQFPLELNPDPSNYTPSAVIVARALLAFKSFMVAYDEGTRDRPGQILTMPQQAQRQVGLAQPPRPQVFNSHGLRQAIARVAPRINAENYEIYNQYSQQDPTECLDLISSLFPDTLKVQMQERKYYDLPRNEVTGQLQPLVNLPNGARLLGDNVSVKDGPLSLPIIKCAMQGSYPNMRNFLQRHFEDPIHDPSNRITEEVDGITYAFPLVKVERQFLTAPSSLWLPPNRFKWVEPPWVGLHRMMPNWFAAWPAHQAKNEAPVEFQEILEIQPINGPLARYKLDGFICHLGSTVSSGHYVSYRVGKDDENNEAWFKINDAVVTRISDAQMRAALATAYLPHYSKIDE